MTRFWLRSPRLAHIYRRTALLESDRKIHSSEFVADKCEEHEIRPSCLISACNMPEKSSYVKEHKDEYMLHAKVNRKYKIYAVFQDGIFLNSLKKSKHLVFSVNTFQLCGIYRKINAAWIQIKLSQFSKCRRHFILKENMMRKIAALFLCTIFFASMHCHNHIIAYIKFYFKQNAIKSHILYL